MPGDLVDHAIGWRSSPGSTAQNPTNATGPVPAASVSRSVESGGCPLVWRDPVGFPPECGTVGQLVGVVVEAVVPRRPHLITIHVGVDSGCGTT